MVCLLYVCTKAGMECYIGGLDVLIKLVRRQLYKRVCSKHATTGCTCRRVIKLKSSTSARTNREKAPVRTETTTYVSFVQRSIAIKRALACTLPLPLYEAIN
jgi:hypothetical protein